MSLPTHAQDEIEERLTQYCRERVPERLRNRMRVVYKIRGVHVTLSEQRPPFMGGGEWTDTPVAQFRFRSPDGTWVLYWMDRHHEWNEYTQVNPTEDFEELLREVDRDPTGIFWG